MEQVPKQCASRHDQQERTRAGTVIQAWWVMHLAIKAAVHFISVKNIKALGHRQKALDGVVDHGSYSRQAPAVHELFVRLQTYDRGAARYKGEPRGTTRKLEEVPRWGGKGQ